MSEEPYSWGQTNEREVEIRLTKKKERVHSSKERRAYKRIRLYPENFLTENNYVDSEIYDKRLFDRVLLTLKNNHASYVLTYQILACIDPEDWHPLKSDTDLAAGARIFEYVTEAWAYVKVQVKSKTSGQSCTLSAFIGGQT